MKNSRIIGFHKLTLAERRKVLGEALGISEGDEAAAEALRELLDSGGLDATQALSMVENVVGVYALPFGIAMNFTVNGVDRLVPMVVEEPSVIAAASNAAKMIRSGGGFEATMTESLVIAQIELRRVPDIAQARARILSRTADVLASAAQAVPGLVRRGGGPKQLEVRELAPDHLVVHISVDARDAMGANLANMAAEAVGPLLAELAGSELGLRILSNLSDERLARVQARVPFESLAPELESGRAVAKAIEAASIFAERDPYRAATHNKGIMNGLDSVLLATGNDYRAVEAGAHAYAARSGRYSPLATWRVEEDSLSGKLELPLAVGVVGGTLRVHALARLALRLAEVETARDLAVLAACAGLASNLAALRALSTEGILRGHMALHARSLATFVGATSEEVEAVAARLSETLDFSEAGAKKALEAERHSRSSLSAPKAP